MKRGKTKEGERMKKWKEGEENEDRGGGVGSDSLIITLN